MAQRDERDRITREPTPGGATGGAGIGASAVSPDSPGNDQSGIVGSGAVWHNDGASATTEGAASEETSFAGSKPGVLGDETEEQNLNQPGNPDARISKDEVDTAFAGDKPRPKYPDELVAPDDGDRK